MARFLKAIRFDKSDEHVFPKAADPGDPVIPGAFAFHREDPGELTGKMRQAFVSGFLSLNTFGWTTLATPFDIDEASRERVTHRLAEILARDYGAPDMDAALAAAGQEIEDTIALCEGLAIDTLLALVREIGEDGLIRERFHLVTPPGDKPHARVWDVVDD